MAHWVARRRADKKRPKWRTLLCAVLVFLAAVAVLASIIVRYVHANILNTDQYVEITSSLAEEPAVSAALGTFTADRLFNNGAVENQVQKFLPDKLAPAAPLVTNTLKDEVQQVATDIAASQAFHNTWLAANRTAHTTLLDVAHGQPRDPSQKAEVVLRLQGLFEAVRQRFGGDDGTLLNTEQKTAAADLAINIRQSAQQLRTTVSMIETSSWLLPLLSIALTAGAIFAANSKRRAILGIGVVFVVLGVTTLFLFRLGSQQLFASFEQEVYKNAAQVIYETFYGNLRVRLVGLSVAGVLLITAALLAGPYVWAVRARKWLHLPN